MLRAVEPPHLARARDRPGEEHPLAVGGDGARAGRAHVEHRLGARDGPVHARNSGSSTEHLELRQLRGQRLLSVSPATIDRLLTAIRRKASHRKPPRRSCAPNVAPWIHWSFCTAFGSLCISASDRGLLCERGNRPFHHSISTSEGGASLVV